MFEADTINAVNSLLGLLLAALLTSFWLKSGKKSSAFLWMIASWMLAFADIMYLVRGAHYFTATTFLATVFVTAAMLLLLVSIQSFMGLRPTWRVGIAIVASHAVAMTCILVMDMRTETRMLLNSLYWSGMATATLMCFRNAESTRWKEWYGFPSLVFACHAVFHVARMIICLPSLVGVQLVSTSVLANLSFAEAGAFSMMLFMSLQMADLRLRNRQLQSALDEVQTLSGLLPICSSCKKIRDDAGYWTKLETYICQHSGAQFSHGLCPDCAMTLYPDVFSGKYGDEARRVCMPSKARQTGGSTVGKSI